MSWSQLPEEVKQVALAELTAKQLDTWKLELAGLSTRAIARHTWTSRTTTIDRLNTAHRRLIQAGIRHQADGSWTIHQTQELST